MKKKYWLLNVSYSQIRRVSFIVLLTLTAMREYLYFSADNTLLMYQITMLRNVLLAHSIFFLTLKFIIENYSRKEVREQ